MNFRIHPNTSLVAFLGLGDMGGPMAANLVKVGYRVHGFDPMPEAMAAAVGAGVIATRSVAQAAADADLVITMLPSGRYVLEAYAEAVPVAAPGAVFLVSSTIDVADARHAAGLAVAGGHAAVDAPVSGGVVGAQAASLTFMVGGPADTFAAVADPLRAMGARAVYCGSSGSGQAAKICNNMILGVSMIAVSEAFVPADKLGLSAQALFDVASTSSAQCWALSVNCPVPGPVPTSPANRDYSGGFGSALMLKDLTPAQSAARANGVDTVITGSEKAFAAGADIKEMAAQSFSDVHADDWFAGWDALTRVRTPIIAAVAGYALGGGSELAMMCDVLIAADTARFGQPEITLGVIPGMGGSQRLTRAVGKAKAMEMCLTGRMIDAQEAERAGLVSRIVPAQDLPAEAVAVAVTIAQMSAPAARMVKEVVNRAFESSLAEGILFERRVFHSTFATADQKEGMAAFVAKRAPEFTHR